MESGAQLEVKSLISTFCILKSLGANSTSTEFGTRYGIHRLRLLLSGKRNASNYRGPFSLTLTLLELLPNLE
jgi:hypothetical protein